jgi:hypothetical protein
MLISANPPCLLGEISGDVICFIKAPKEWPQIVGLFRSGCGEADVFTYEYRSGHYVQIKDILIHDYNGCSEGEITEFYKSLGPINCAGNKKRT